MLEYNTVDMGFGAPRVNAKDKAMAIMMATPRHPREITLKAWVLKQLIVSSLLANVLSLSLALASGCARSRSVGRLSLLVDRTMSRSEWSACGSHPLRLEDREGLPIVFRLDRHPCRALARWACPVCPFGPSTYDHAVRNCVAEILSLNCPFNPKGSPFHCSFWLCAKSEEDGETEIAFSVLKNTKKWGL